MTAPFVHKSRASTVHFGSGAIARLPHLLRAAGLSRALVLTTPGQTELGKTVIELLGELSAGHFAQARMHTPIDTSLAAITFAQKANADCLVAIGGGSTTGLSKAISIRTGLPQLIIATTYAGSEVTPILGETENGVKRTRRDDAILPGTVIYDPDLTLNLPLDISITSGVNALAHAVEALYAPDTNPIMSLYAREAISTFARALPAIAANPQNTNARAEALYAAWLCGICLGSTEMGLHHKICHVLGGSFDLAHAPTHCIMLPHVLAYNCAAAPEAYAAVSAALGTEDAATGLHALIQALAAPTALRDIGMPHDGLAAVVTQLISAPYTNPAPLEPERLTRMLENAWSGNAPSA